MSDKNQKEVLEANKKKILLYEDDGHLEQEQQEETRSLVVFSVGEEWYGVDVQCVREVVPKCSITPLPHVPSHLLGILNLRGDILSVTDLSVLFSLPGVVHSETDRFVVIKEGTLSTALIVNGSVESMEIPLSQFESLNSDADSDKAKLVECQVNVGEKLIGILNVEKLLDYSRINN